MVKEEILSPEQVRESLFDNRRNSIMLDGIREYIKRNHTHYTLEQVFEFNCTILGAYQLYHDEKND